MTRTGSLIRKLLSKSFSPKKISYWSPEKYGLWPFAGNLTTSTPCNTYISLPLLEACLKHSRLIRASPLPFLPPSSCHNSLSAARLIGCQGLLGYPLGARLGSSLDGSSRASATSQIDVVNNKVSERSSGLEEALERALLEAYRLLQGDKAEQAEHIIAEGNTSRREIRLDRLNIDSVTALLGACAQVLPSCRGIRSLFHYDCVPET